MLPVCSDSDCRARILGATLRRWKTNEKSQDTTPFVPKVGRSQLMIKNLRICNLQTDTPIKFADLRLQNEPKNLRIYDFRTKKKFMCPPSPYTLPLGA